MAAERVLGSGDALLEGQKVDERREELGLRRPFLHEFRELGSVACAATGLPALACARAGEGAKVDAANAPSTSARVERESRKGASMTVNGNVFWVSGVRRERPRATARSEAATISTRTGAGPPDGSPIPQTGVSRPYESFFFSAAFAAARSC